MKSSPAQRHARAGPGPKNRAGLVPVSGQKIVLGSCPCRAKKSCYGLAHEPRAKWPSIVVVVLNTGETFALFIISLHFRPDRSIDQCVIEGGEKKY
jgi:hypothetical protein